MRPQLAAAIVGCFLATALHAQFNDIPNDIKYSDTSRPHARGRSGSAAIEARALVGKDGATELVVTTGSIDPAAAGPGNIDKVQVKVADTARNFNGLNAGGLFTRTFTGLRRGVTLQVQANVSGVDPHRTDVVTVTEQVKLRPDLAVEQLLVQPHAAVGVPFHVSALLRERNGDVGARTNCVLLAGGVEVDRANHLWIDANGTVTCQLVHTFEAAGMQNLQVALTNANPGDYDESNNTAAASVQVYASATEMPNWTSSVGDATYEAHYVTRNSQRDMETHDSGWARMTSFSAYLWDQEESWESLRLSYQEAHDGEIAVDLADVQWTARGRCFVSHEQGMTIEKCRIMPGRHGPSTPILQIFISRGGGGATFRSHGWYLQYDWASDRWDRYTVNSETSHSYGTDIEVGDTVAMTVRASDGTNFWEATPFMTLTPSETRDETPYSCSTEWSDEPYCFGSSYQNVGRAGNDAGGF